MHPYHLVRGDQPLGDGGERCVGLRVRLPVCVGVLHPTRERVEQGPERAVAEAVVVATMPLLGEVHRCQREALDHVEPLGAVPPRQRHGACAWLGPDARSRRRRRAWREHRGGELHVRGRARNEGHAPIAGSLAGKAFLSAGGVRMVVRITTITSAEYPLRSRTGEPEAKRVIPRKPRQIAQQHPCEELAEHRRLLESNGNLAANFCRRQHERDEQRHMGDAFCSGGTGGHGRVRPAVGGPTKPKPAQPQRTRHPKGG